MGWNSLESLVWWNTQSFPPSLFPEVLNDVHAGRYIHGVAVHWYMDSFVPAEISLGVTHHLYPEYYLFGTEACAGFSPLDRGVKLGSWQRAEQYAHDIIEVRESWLALWSQIHRKGYAISRWAPLPIPLLQCRLGSGSLPYALLSNCLRAVKAGWCWVSSLIRKLDSLCSI